MTTLPACCFPSDNAEPAEALYCIYQRGGPLERAGLAYDGRPCPTWAELLTREDEGSRGVVAKWRQLAETVGPKWITSESSAPPVGVLCVGRWVRVECPDEIVVARIEEPEYPGGLNAWACACDSGWQTVRPPDFWHPLAPFGGEK